MARPKSPGRVFYLGRLRVLPEDPPELVEVLEAIVQAGPERRAAILKAALTGGASEATREAGRGEDELETENLINDLFS